MPNLHGFEGIIYVGGSMALVMLGVVLWIRWEDRHPRPPTQPKPKL